MNVAVLTDSTSDLDHKTAADLGVEVIPLRVHFAGREWLDHQELTTAELFRRVASGAALPRTSPPSVEDFCRKFDELLYTHDHVFALHLSSKLSETYANAAKAAAQFPRRVTVYDTWQSAGALAMQAQRAKALLDSGVPAAQVSVLLSKLRPQVFTHMAVNTLDYLQMSGRIGGAAALVGGLLHMKPILALKAGRVEGLSRAIGQGRALKQMNELLREYAATTNKGRVALFHNGNEEGVQALRRQAQALGLCQSFTLDLGTVLSAHGGPGVFGFSFEPVTIWHEFRAY